MKILLLISLYLLPVLHSTGQETVKKLPPGKYDTRVVNQQWEKGDIVLLDEGQYRISSAGEVGEYRFSVTAQRVFFTSGPLKGIYATTQLTNNTPEIYIPLTENRQLGFKLAPADIIGRLSN